MQLVALHPASHDAWDEKSVALNGTKVSFTEVNMEMMGDMDLPADGASTVCIHTWLVLLSSSNVDTDLGGITVCAGEQDILIFHPKQRNKKT